MISNAENQIEKWISETILYYLLRIEDMYKTLNLIEPNGKTLIKSSINNIGYSILQCCYSGYWKIFMLDGGDLFF